MNPILSLAALVVFGQATQGVPVGGGSHLTGALHQAT